jgi:hypothetical protein
MKLTALESVLYHIRVNHYGLCFDDADHLEVNLLIDQESDLLTIRVWDTSTVTFCDFDYVEMLEEIAAMRAGMEESRHE